LPKVQYIGRISYSTYILHVVIVNAIGWVMVFFAGGNNFSRELMLMVMIAVGFPVIFCASILLNKYIEKPGIQFGKKVNSYMLKARVNKGLINE